MLPEVLSVLTWDRSGYYLDGTLGEGGHARAILAELEPPGCLFGVDRDPDALEIARRNLAPFGDRVQLAHGNFRDLPALCPEPWRGRVSGILLDLGLRSSALDEARRGFSFQQDGPLDMRFDPTAGPAAGPSAADLLARIDARELERILEAGTTRARPRRIARAILDWRTARRPLTTTGELVECLRQGLGRRADRKLLSSVFSALRMEVNHETDDLDEALATLPGLLRIGGVLCVLSYQSQEDRRVKLAGRATAEDPRSGVGIVLEPVTKKPIRPSADEQRRNRRSRSAMLRVLRRIATPSPS